jgi:hypothetical protein
MKPILTIISPLLLLAALLYFWLQLAVKASGWEKLAHQYRWPAPFEGDSYPRQTVWFSFGLVLWRSLTIKANEEGLLFQPHFPYAHFATKLRIPWEDLRLGRSGELRCAGAPEVRMRISPTLHENIIRLQHDLEPPRAPDPT